jgi:hypothetical protein
MRPRPPGWVIVALLTLLAIEALGYADWAITIGLEPPPPPVAHPDMNWAPSLIHMFDSLIPWIRLGLATWAALTLASGVGVWRGWSVAWYVAFALQLPQVAALSAVLLGTVLTSDPHVSSIGLAGLVFAVPMGAVVLLCRKVVRESVGIRMFGPARDSAA